MPTTVRREDAIVRIFLSVYEDCSWADATLDWVDKRQDSAVEVVATRKSDGTTLAIEHTIVEPFVTEKQDFAHFKTSGLLRLEEDPALLVPARWIGVFIPVGTMRAQQSEGQREEIIQSIREWLMRNGPSLPSGDTHQLCPIGAGRDIQLSVKVVKYPGKGKITLRRQQTENDLDEVVRKAIRRKIPKLLNTAADKCILLLERQHMNLYPSRMLDAIARLSACYPEVRRVHQTLDGGDDGL